MGAPELITGAAGSRCPYAAPVSNMFCMEWMLPRLCAVLSFLLSVSVSLPVAAAEPTTAPQASAIPVGVASSDKVQRLWRTILEEADIPVAFVQAPISRKRRMFVEGRILLDCCSAKKWRDQPDEQRVQVWTRPLYANRDVYVFRAGEVQPVRTPFDLMTKKVAIVHGFSYEGLELFGQAVPGRNTADVLHLLAARRADVGIMSDGDFLALTEDRPDEFEMGNVRTVAEQRARAHTSVAHLIPQIENAVERLRQRNEMQALLSDQH
jgi:hypothetical protein